MRECEYFKFDYKSVESRNLAHSVGVRYAPNEEEDINKKASNITMKANLKYGDRLRNTRFTQFYVLHMTAFRKFINCIVRKKSVLEFLSQVRANIQSGASKSYYQSDIGTISRRFKLGAERIYF